MALKNILHLTSKKQSFTGEISLPASKSISNRLLIIRFLCGKNFTIFNLSEAEDTVILQCLLEKISSHNIDKDDFIVLDAGDAGTVYRFLTALLAIIPGKWLLTGSDRMQQRPVEALVDALLRIGADVKYVKKEGFPPLKIIGRALQGGITEMDAGVSSQFISALMMIAPKLFLGLKIQLKGKPVSASYIDLTSMLLKEFSISISLESGCIYLKNQNFREKNVTVEPDWSSASYWYELVALSKDASVFIRDLKKESIQGDVAMSEVFSKLGVTTTFTKEGAILQKSQITITALECDCSRTPDLVPALAVSCAGLGIRCRLTGLETLVNKESNRLLSLKNELEKFGISVKIVNNSGLIISGSLKPSQIPVETYNDHRIAMAFAPLVLLFGKIVINNPSVVKKSYPRFWEHLFYNKICSEKTN